MIFHIVPLNDWLTAGDRPYAPESLASDGFVHCSPDEATTLAVATAFYADAPSPLLALLIDEHELDAPVRWEVADPTPPPGVPAETLFPHIYGRITHSAVDSILEVERDETGQATALKPWS